MTQRYCESCGNLFDSKATTGATPEGSYLCPNCATKKAADPAPQAEADGSIMEKGGGLKKTVDKAGDEKLTFRCPNCNALLSSRKIEKRSRLSCPKCSEKVIINPDGTAELLSKRAPHMKKMDMPEKQKVYSDADLERLLDFGETQPAGRDSSRPAPKPKPPSGRREAAPAPQPAASPAPAPAPAGAGSEGLSGPQYRSSEDEERLKFLDQVQGPGKRKATSGPPPSHAETRPPAKKGPPTRKKLTKFGTDRHKSESVEDRLETAKLKRAAIRNKVLAVAFIVLPILFGVIAYYSASRPVEEDKEPSVLARLVKGIGAKTRSGALALNEHLLHQELVVPEEPAPEEQPGTGEEPDKPVEPPVEPDKPVEPPVEPDKPVEPPVEPDKPVEPPVEPDKPVEPPVEPDKPVEPPVEPDKPVEPPVEPDKPVEPPVEPDKPKEPAVEPDKPEEPASEPGPKEPKVEVTKCANCGKTILKDAAQCPWCGFERPQAPKPPKTH